MSSFFEFQIIRLKRFECHYLNNLSKALNLGFLLLMILIIILVYAVTHDKVTADALIFVICSTLARARNRNIP